MPGPRIKHILILPSLLVLQGCLSTWVHMEDGTVLSPGRVDFQLSAGEVPTLSANCPEGNVQLRSGSPVCLTNRGYTIDPSTHSVVDLNDTVPAKVTSTPQSHYAAAWSLGSLGPFGPFKGLEVGLQVEGPTYPISQEFRATVGLPSPDSIWSHSLGAGWGIGMWADDTWFFQYAASWSRGNLRLFGNWRSTLQATRMEFVSLPSSFHHDRTWDHQATAGCKYRLGDIPVIPDWIGAAATLDLSHTSLPDMNQSELPQRTGLGFSWNATMGWSW